MTTFDQNFIYKALPEAHKHVAPHEFRRVLKKANEAVQDFKNAELQLIKSLQAVYRIKAHRRVGFNSLHQFAIKSLELTKSQSYQYITVARKAFDFPKLQEALKSREITVSKAQRICSVMKPENEDHWLELAKTLSKNKLEKEIARVNPRSRVPDQAKYISDKELELTLSISEDVFEKLEKVRSLVNQKTKKNNSLEEVLEELCSFYIDKKDPIETAKRAQARKSLNTETTRKKANCLSQENKKVGSINTSNTPSKRKSIPAATLHRIHLKGQRSCQFKNKDGKVCGETQWLELHHKIPLTQGGNDSVENLITLCSGHHKVVHEFMDLDFQRKAVNHNLTNG